MGSVFLPYGRQSVDDEDIRAVVDVLSGDWLTGGPTVEAFETAFAARVGARYAVACASGTAALHLAVLAAGGGPDWTALVPSQTFVATANAVRLAGGEVAFADVDPDSGLTDTERLEAAARGASNLRLVLPVHLNGACVEMAALAEWAARRDLVVIEDAAHALGSKYRDVDGAEVTVGSCRHSHMTIFSLHPVKTVTMVEGGVVTTNDERLACRLRLLRNHGIVRDPAEFSPTGEGGDGAGRPDPWYYEMRELGLNYRASDIHCALGLSQLNKLEQYVARRARLKERYERLLRQRVAAARPVVAAGGQAPAWHLAPVLIEFAAMGFERGEVMRRLAEYGVGSQVHYIPVHRQPYYRQRYGDQSLPGAEAYYRRVLSLPLFPAMADEDVDRVVESLRLVLESA